MELLLFFLKGLIATLRKNNAVKDLNFLAFYSFLTRTNFEVPVSDKRKILIVERYLYRLVKTIWNEHDKIKLTFSGTSLHLHNSEHGVQVWNSFLSEQLKENPLFFVTKSEVLNLKSNFKDKIRITFYCFLLYPLVKYFSFYNAYRQNSILLFNAYPICINLLRVIKDNNITRLIYTGCYEPEGNIISLWLKKNDIHVVFVVSGTPLYRFLKEMVCAEVILSNPYQAAEVSFFHETVKADSIRLFPPNSYRRINLFDTGNSDGKNTIGYYSSGLRVRKEKDTVYSFSIEEMELRIIAVLNNFLCEHKQYKLIVFLHPVEKRNSDEYNKSRKYFAEKFSTEARVSFASIETSTIDDFRTVDVAITFVSNLIFERLFGGYKVLHISAEKGVFPLKGNALDLITAGDEMEFIFLLGKFLRESNDEYFKQNNLLNYYKPTYALNSNVAG